MFKLKSFITSSWLNKYSISLIVFVLWIGFLDKYSWVKQFRVNQNISKLKDQKEEYIQLLEEAKIEQVDIKKHKEKYAREKYFLHKKGEEVFIIE
jgi:hypothetical protein